MFAKSLGNLIKNFFLVYLLLGVLLYIFLTVHALEHRTMPANLSELKSKFGNPFK